MGRISVTKSNSTRIKGSSLISLDCKECGTPVNNVDSNTASVICSRCVAKSLNPHTRFLDEIPLEEFRKLISSSVKKEEN